MSMVNIASDSAKNIAVFINDFDQEFADGLQKLSLRLERPLSGMILLDKEIKTIKRNTPDTDNVFEQIVCDFSDDAALHATIKTFQKNLLLVTCSSERNQPYLRKVLPHMPHILGPTESSLEWSTHKGKMREMLASYDKTLVPKVQVIFSDKDAEIRKVTDTLTFPVIIKPTGLASSILVSMAHSEAELRAIATKSFAVIRDIYDRDRGRGTPSMIVEEFIEGDMYSVDAYVNEVGKVWPLPLLRSKPAHAVGRKGFYTYQTDSYLEIGPDEIEAGHQAATRAIHALGLRSCVAHIELFHTTTGWKIIELGPRAGGQRQDIYAAAYGVDHAYNELLVKIGLEPEINTNPVAYCTTVNFYAEEDGIITAIEGFDEANANPSMLKLSLYAKPGDRAVLSTNGGKIIIDGLMVNTDLEQLHKDAGIVRSSVKIITRRS